LGTEPFIAGFYRLGHTTITAGCSIRHPSSRTGDPTVQEALMAIDIRKPLKKYLPHLMNWTVPGSA
jgi:hypothetical protein